jgi:F-type H+-transporting ATPase subunit g
LLISRLSSRSSVATFQTYFQNAWKAAQKPSALLQSTTQGPATALQQVRGLSRAQVAAGAVIFAELLGFFTVGEMIGRFKLIGYHGETAHH